MNIVSSYIHALEGRLRIKIPEVKGAPDDPLVTGTTCQRSALFLFAWGDSSYASAVADALKGAGRDGILYDVKADMKVNSYVIGIYTKVCTYVTGKVAKL